MDYLDIFSMTFSVFMIGLVFGFVYSWQIRLVLKEYGLWSVIRSVICYISGRMEK